MRAPTDFPTNGYRRGSFQHRNKRAVNNKLRLSKELERYAIVNLSGYAAQFKYLQKDLDYNVSFVNKDGSESPNNDYRSVRDEMSKANKLLGRNYYSETSFLLWELKTRELLERKNVWRAIEILAKKLLAAENFVVDGEEAERFLKKYLTGEP